MTPEPAPRWRKSSHSAMNGNCAEITVVTLACFNGHHGACDGVHCACGCHIPDPAA